MNSSIFGGISYYFSVSCAGQTQTLDIQRIIERLLTDSLLQTIATDSKHVNVELEKIKRLES